MPLPSFAFTGCVMGHAPSAPGSTEGSTLGDSARGAASGTEGRGTGGKGNGADSHEIARCWASVCAIHARHPAYASPARIPVLSSRFDPLRMGEFSHGCGWDAESDVDATKRLCRMG